MNIWYAINGQCLSSKFKFAVFPVTVLLLMLLTLEGSNNNYIRVEARVAVN